MDTEPVGTVVTVPFSVSVTTGAGEIAWLKPVHSKAAAW